MTKPSYSAALMREARQLADDGGFSAPEIRRLFERRGVERVPALITIYRWIDDDFRAEHDRQVRDRSARQRAERSRGRLGAVLSREPTPEFKLERMRALREEAGLKDEQIARVMTFDFGEPMTRAKVALSFETGRYPRSLR